MKMGFDGVGWWWVEAGIIVLFITYAYMYTYVYR